MAEYVSVGVVLLYEVRTLINATHVQENEPMSTHLFSMRRFLLLFNSADSAGFDGGGLVY